MTLITFCYFSSSIYFAFFMTNRKDASSALQKNKKKNVSRKKNFFNANKFHSFFHLLAAIYYRAKEMDGKKVKNAPTNEEFSHWNICMKKSATAAVVATTTASASSFITEARANFFASTFDLGRCNAHLL